VSPGFANLRAHTNADDGRVDSLEKHLARVSELAREFSSEVGASEFGIVIGLLHDIGKALPEFQEYLGRLEAGERFEVRPAPRDLGFGSMVRNVRREGLARSLPSNRGSPRRAKSRV